MIEVERTTAEKKTELVLGEVRTELKRYGSYSAHTHMLVKVSSSHDEFSAVTH
jgi:hypothetical protein